MRDRGCDGHSVSTENGSEIIIRLDNVAKNYSGVQALGGVSETISRGSIHGLVGTNGSGKSTLFNLIAGSLSLSDGAVEYDGEDVTHLGAYQMSRRGVGRTFQAGALVPTLSCLDNVLTGFSTHLKFQLLGGLFPVSALRRRMESQFQVKAYALLQELGLSNCAYEWAGELVWAQKQKVQIARAIANEPKLLLLDEPTAGMGAEETREIEEIVRKINATGVTVMIVSHDTALISRLCNRVTALIAGRLICSGTPAEVYSHPDVKKAYLGHG